MVLMRAAAAVMVFMLSAEVAEEMASILNEYLAAMTEVIFAHGGTIDKFIGDAIMVIFGAPQDMGAAEQAQRACDCASAMQQAMMAISNDWESEGVGDVKMRIG